MTSNPALCNAIAYHISTSPQRRITFAEFMDLALYHPEHGYYSSHAVKIGFQGSDFFTSPHLGADFGELLAEQFWQMWDILARPVPFSLVEMGAGQGLLAMHILNYSGLHYPDFFAALDYVIVEKSPGFQQEQQQRLQDFSVRWCSLEDIPTDSITGCFFSNELVDALPVHQFILTDGKMHEVYVTTGKDDSEPLFLEVTGEPSTPELQKYLDLVEIDLTARGYEDGYRSEINLAAGEWLSIVADRLHRGYVLTIDYGYPADRYYNPRRSQGSLQCYYNHRHHDNPYINVGMQDITAHVDFTALERWGDRFKLEKIGFIQQGLFLMALGLGERLSAISHQELPLSQLLQRREALHQLIDPTELGNFGVLIQSKGLQQTEIAQPLKGLTVPG
ncbi:class I SAM-dependent methyltransferase [Nodularia spumigena CS-586/05]|uniref:class I SAM-dependent methyltransferase n=1 Tax=Nodularia spumigena TaxID=70799 RepID=UPI00232DED38|nr:class I SAM-dependent methyltransferase [Nodularia spumigena]MDB9321143.1 class I SAM-dependent methyltransferase [Nodularia spumigena CS-591/07A]MDB9332763.1 class I SAM-dependent methyltransferase [Nodularia spumigena CS-591/04]MDB9344497.1 class I SAM-dependent methyltransferase [Nodularia spumigena CS-588/06]MDB9346243.1 class I SAM-dependent methyltransferase [Nodularia spumigena CS-588/01]MDB9352987.1 class I SAM-dependent methyltransferase [Nodularia spumigena CS-588/05]